MANNTFMKLFKTESENVQKQKPFDDDDDEDYNDFATKSVGRKKYKVKSHNVSSEEVNK